MNLKIVNLCFAAIFLAILLVPLLFADITGGAVSEDENRVLAQRPPISFALQRPTQFIRMFDDWFTDNIGFRSNLIAIYNSTIASDMAGGQIREIRGDSIYLFGEEGHKFYAGDIDTGLDLIPKFQGKPFLSYEEMSELAAGLTEIREYTSKRGISLVMMICTDKDTVYPEYYPKYIIRGPEPAQVDIITEYIRENAQVDIFNTRRCLEKEKQNFLLYNKTYDVFHWNEIGAFFAYRELAKRLGIFPDDIFSIDDVEISYNNDNEDELNIPDISLKRDVSFYKTEGYFDSIGFDYLEENTFFNWAFINNDDDLPTALIIRDSYFGYGGYDDVKLFMAGYLPEHFGKTIMVHKDHIVHLYDFIDVIKPDVVILETTEAGLPEYVYLIDSVIPPDK